MKFLNIKLKVRTLDFRLVPKAAVIRDTRGLIKMIVEDGTESITIAAQSFLKDVSELSYCAE